MDTVQLVESCQTGDRDAFGRLYGLYADSMLRVIEAIVRDHEAARDILHDGFIVAFSSVGGLNDPRKFGSWLTTIMRNLSLQYLRTEAERAALPISAAAADVAYEEAHAEPLSWDEIRGFLDRLPEGYSRVFRLAVLDGLSHKEIGTLLGIAPHSSSSQLSHAKAMLRRMIAQHCADVVGIFMAVLTVVCLWLGLNRHPAREPGPLVAKDTEQGRPSGASVEVTVADTLRDKRREVPVRLRTGVPTRMVPEDNLAAESERPAPTATEAAPPDSMATDSVMIPRYSGDVDGKRLMADNRLPSRPKDKGWSLALNYAGGRRLEDEASFRIPDDISDAPNAEPVWIDVREESRHYVPVVVGLTLSRALTERWSLESGVRYTYLRSDFLRESEHETVEKIQRIHYIGIPVKVNYRVAGNEKFTLYGQGGMGVDIPVRATHLTTELREGWNEPAREHLKVSAPVQWSVEFGVGVQYRFTPSMGIYAEPSLRYYFNPGGGVSTIRQDRPAEFSIPVGIRLDL